MSTTDFVFAAAAVFEEVHVTECPPHPRPSPPSGGRGEMWSTTRRRGEARSTTRGRGEPRGTTSAVATSQVSPLTLPSPPEAGGEGNRARNLWTGNAARTVARLRIHSSPDCGYIIVPGVFSA